MKTNKLRIITAVAIAMIAISGNAQDYSKFYRKLPVTMKQVEMPTIPANEMNINECGGVGDGVTLNTEAFAKAISRLTKLGGGRLNVPAGVWLTGPIKMKSNIELHLDKNAIIYFSPDKELFIDSDGKSSRVTACISASKHKNIAITGEGIIDGNGDQWRPVKRSKVSDTEWSRYMNVIGGQTNADGSVWYPWNVKAGYKNIAATPEKQEAMRNDIIRLTDCENILIQGVTIQNSPRFHVHPCYCENVIIDGITVRCMWNAQNGDGIDLSDCHRAVIVNSTVDTGDDGLCMKSGNQKNGRPWGCEDIVIENNTVFHAHGGFVIGSEDIGGMRNIVVRNNKFSGTDTGLRFKSSIGRGGKTENIFCHDIVMTDIGSEAIVFQCDYANKPAGGVAEKASEKLVNVPDFQDIHIYNIVCRGCKTGVKAHGIENMRCVHDIDIKNSTIVYHGADKDIDTATAQLTLENVKIVKEVKQ